MKILISTVNRFVPFDQPTGYMFTFDMETKKVIQKTAINEVPYQREDPNPRGGLRGQKGFSMHGDMIGLVNASTIFLYDKHWKPIRFFFHPSCSAIHELAITNEAIWVTATGNDHLLKFDHFGKLLSSIDVRKMTDVISSTGWKIKPFLSEDQIRAGGIDFRDPRTHDMIDTDKAHINSVFALEDGSLLISLGLLKNANFSRLLAVKKKLTQIGAWKWFITANNVLRKTFFKNASQTKGEMLIQAANGVSAIVRISPTGKADPLFHFAGASVPSHSVRVLKDGSGIYLNTTDGKLIHFDVSTGRVISAEKLGSKFLRGARQLSDGTLVLGDGNQIIHYDIAARKIIERIQITDESAPAVFDFCELPDDYDLPPTSLVELHESYLPLDQINMPK